MVENVSCIGAYRLWLGNELIVFSSFYVPLWLHPIQNYERKIYDEKILSSGEARTRNFSIAGPVLTSNTLLKEPAHSLRVCRLLWNSLITQYVGRFSDGNKKLSLINSVGLEGGRYASRKRGNQKLSLHQFCRSGGKEVRKGEEWTKKY